MCEKNFTVLCFIFAGIYLFRYNTDTAYNSAEKAFSVIKCVQTQ